MKVVYFPTAADFHAWLEAAPKACLELWVGFYKKTSGKPSITYPEAIDEALCFGWIDGVRKRIDGNAYMQRFTPRKAKSQWSAVNIRHVERLTAARQMQPAGLAAFEGARDQPRKYSYEQRNAACLEPSAERQFRAKPKAWEFFQAQAPWYRRTATFWVSSAKKEETRQKRLETLIAASVARRRIDPLAPSRPSVSKQAKKAKKSDSQK